MAPDLDLRRACLEFELALDTGVSDEVAKRDWGRVFLARDLPLVWEASWISVEKPGLELGRIAELADAELGGAGFAHRTAAILGEEEGRRVAAEARGLEDWEVETVLYMVHTSRDADGPSAAAEPVRLEEIEPLRRQLIEESLPPAVPHAEDTVEQLLELERSCGLSSPTAGSSRPPSACPPPRAACSKQAGSARWRTSPPRGGRAGAASRRRWFWPRRPPRGASGNRLTFLSADANDWPRLM